MKEIIEKFFNMISKEKISSAFTESIVNLEEERKNIRKDSLDEIEKYDPLKDGQKIKDVLMTMNKEISNSYEREIFLREFISKLN
jgi:hypothetical protein